MTTPDDDKSYLSRADEFLQLFKKGAEFTQDLLRENERLRFRVVELEGELRSRPLHDVDQLTARAASLHQRVAELEQEKAAILEHIRRVEEENDDFASRYVEVEEANNMLANLYVASFQLHATLDFKTVLQNIVEIVINLIGAEEFAVLLLDGKTGCLEAVVCEGVGIDAVPAIQMGQGVIGTAVQSGECYCVDDIEGYRRDLHAPMTCIPLMINGEAIGAIVIYKLLMQKRQFTSVDHELFALLGGHAATAVCSSRIYMGSERKLMTIQSLIELLSA
jgi:transcriptional regulator with GAF, ATPase, and Fis domain